MRFKFKTYYQVCISSDGHPYIVGKYPIDSDSLQDKPTKAHPKRIGFLRRLVSGGAKCSK